MQAAIEVFDEWRAGDDGVDRVLTRWGRAHRFAGSGDRHAISDLVYDAMRRMRSGAWVAGAAEPADGRSVLRGSLLLDGADPEALFTGEGHAPAPLSEAERRPARPLDGAPRPVRLDYPDWLAGDLADTADATLAALRARAPLDLRVNLLKATPEAAIAALAGDGIGARPGPLSPTALRVTAGQRRVGQSRAYREGLVEIQDAASQAVADLAGARPGETALDLCAGGGGKTLALAATMRGDGRLFAHDVASRRIAGLPERAARARAEVTILPTDGLASMTGVCDLVFIDAPCSGSGAWRRNPDAKWRLTPEALDRLTAAQDALLAQAAEMAAPDGRIAYATCSILARENEARIAAFLSPRPGWRVLRRLSAGPPEGDGFFAAVLKAAPVVGK